MVDIFKFSSYSEPTVGNPEVIEKKSLKKKENPLQKLEIRISFNSSLYEKIKCLFHELV